MNIFLPKEYFWVRALVSEKVIIYIAFLLFINISNLTAQSTDEVQRSENTYVSPKPIPFTRSLKKLARSLKSDAKNNFRNALKLAKIHNWTLQKTLADGRVLSLQGIDEFNNPIYYITHSQVSPSACTRTNSLYYGGSLGVSLNGSSSLVKDRLGLWDGGLVRTSHQEFGTNRIKQIDAPNYFNEHATHTAGILVGAGVNKLARGMAFGGNLKVWDFSDDISEMAFAAKGLLVSNHSYGVLAGWVLNPERSGIIGRARSGS